MVHDADSTWKVIQKEAASELAKDPLAEKVLKDLVLSRDSLASSLAAILACQLEGTLVDREAIYELCLAKFRKYPSVIQDSVCDLWATMERDAACHSLVEPLLFFKGFQAIQSYRVSHALWKSGRTFAAFTLQSLSSRKFSVDIHPAAKIGHGILLDHATNLVIGETAKIGNNVSLMHGVTLGGTGKDSGDRHPKLSDGVMIGAHAQLLGNIRIGKGAKIGAGAVVLGDVPPHTTFAGIPAVMVGHPTEEMPSFDMDQSF